MSVRAPSSGAARSIGVLGICWMLGAASLAGCTSGSADALKEADALVARGEPVAAEQLLRRVAHRLEAGGQAADGAAWAAAIDMRLFELNAGPLHNLPQAIYDAEAAIRHAPGSDLALAAERHLADLYRFRLLAPGRAVPHLRAAAQALGTRAEAAEVRSALVQALMASQGYAEAHAEAEAIVNRWPASAAASRARLAMGQADFMQGRFAEATSTLEALVDAAPSPVVLALAQVELGNCHEEMGHGHQALEHYFGALRHHPNAAMVQDKIARVRHRLLHLAPRPGVLNASRPSRHIAAWRPRPTPAELGIGPALVDGDDG